MEVLYSSDAEMFMVRRDDSTGELILSVVVGGVGMYQVDKKMTPEMIDAFHRNPTNLLEYVKEIRLTA